SSFIILLAHSSKLFPYTTLFRSWVEFRIEPKTKLNSIIDAYKLMFEKYPIDSCIDPEQNRPLNLKIVLDINYDEIEKYGKKFERSEEHTSELQSRFDLVCRLLLE